MILDRDFESPVVVARIQNPMIAVFLVAHAEQIDFKVILLLLLFETNLSMGHNFQFAEPFSTVFA